MLVLFFIFNIAYASLDSNFSLCTGVLSHNYSKNSEFFDFDRFYWLPVETRGYFNFDYFYFTPKWVITPLAKTSDDGAVKSYVSFLSFPFSFKFNERFYYSLGFSMYWNILQGQGGITERADGTGTSNFARPDYTQTTQQLLFQIEGVYSFNSDYDIGAEIYMGQVFQDRQHFHFLVTLRKHFELKFLRGLQ